MGVAPKAVTKGSRKNPMEQNLPALEKFQSFQIGAVVRVRLDKNIFTKGYAPRYTTKTYIIGGIKGYNYELYNHSGNLESRTRKWYELQKIDSVSKTPLFAREQAALNSIFTVLPQNDHPRIRKQTQKNQTSAHEVRVSSS
ncbi:hypothetical protein DFS34DRAFT_103772 [Phlyctochytrium arcticum]|nr:hypothetical protein DFS34DRAFT_103772 [Phlyctochytrium arcticum]